MSEPSGLPPEFFAELREQLLRPLLQGQRIAQERWEARQRELSAIQRQRAIDAVWERTLAAKAEAEAKRLCFHRWPGDPDMESGR
jgi:hypothetical protein